MHRGPRPSLRGLGVGGTVATAVMVMIVMATAMAGCGGGEAGVNGDEAG